MSGKYTLEMFEGDSQAREEQEAKEKEVPGCRSRRVPL